MNSSAGQPQQPVSPREELVDVVDELDRVVATVTRREMRAGRLRHRCVFIAAVHADGRLLVHRRSEHKDVWPGWWDIAVGGVVSAGEAFDAAAVRELAEEVGVHDATPVPIDAGHVQAYDDADVSLLGRCYRVVHAGPFTFADGEVVEARWVTATELDTLAEQQQFLPDSMALLRPLLHLR